MAVMAQWLTRLRAASWSHIAGIVFFALFVLSGSRMFLNEDTRQALKAFVLGILVLLAAIKYTAGFAGGLDRCRAARCEGRSSLYLVLVVQPAEVFGLQRHLMRLVAGFLRWIFRRPPPALPPGTSFTYLRKSSYPALAAVLAIGLIVELPAGVLLMKALGMSPEKQALLHQALFIVTAWIFVLGLGDRYWMRVGRHVIGTTHLHLRLGARISADVPLALIRSVEEISRQPLPRERRHSAPHDVRITPWEAPNVCIRLSHSAPCAAVVLGANVGEVAVVRLYVDDPTQFVAALRNCPAVCANDMSRESARIPPG